MLQIISSAIHSNDNQCCRSYGMFLTWLWVLPCVHAPYGGRLAFKYLGWETAERTPSVHFLQWGEGIFISRFHEVRNYLMSICIWKEINCANVSRTAVHCSDISWSEVNRTTVPSRGTRVRNSTWAGCKETGTGSRCDAGDTFPLLPEKQGEVAAAVKAIVGVVIAWSSCRERKA